MASANNSDIALITGASAGIGRAFAQALAPQCSSMILVARNAEKLSCVAESLAGVDCEIHCIAVDLCKPLGVAEVMEAIRQKGPVTILINNAGFTTDNALVDSDLDTELEMLSLHCQASVSLCRGALPYMQELGRGRVINVASMAGLIPMKGAAVYGASKAFLVAFSQSLAKENHRHGIAVQCLCPGYTHSDFHGREALAGFDKRSIPEEYWSNAEDVVAASLAAFSQTPPPTLLVPGEHNKQWVREEQERQRAALEAMP
jgi:short-subunit dehydrogenase